MSENMWGYFLIIINPLGLQNKLNIFDLGKMDDVLDSFCHFHWLWDLCRHFHRTLVRKIYSLDIKNCNYSNFRLPFYYELKIIILLWLISPVSSGSLGSSILYRKFVHPSLMRREEVSYGNTWIFTGSNLLACFIGLEIFLGKQQQEVIFRLRFN